MNPEEISSFVEPLLDGYAFAKGSRFTQGGGTVDATKFRLFGNRMLANITNLLHRSEYTDVTYGYNAIKKQYLERTEFRSNGFSIETEIAIRAKKAGLKTIEVPSFESARISGVAKLMGEIQLWWSRNTDIGIARIFSAYGENESLGGKAHAMGDLIQRAILNKGGDFMVYGNGKQTRDFLYVTDCARALLKLEEKASNPPITANIGSGQAVSIGALAKKIVKLSGKKFNIVFDTTKPVGPVSRTADMSRARALLDWEPQVSLDDGLRNTYTWIEKRLKSQSV